MGSKLCIFLLEKRGKSVTDHSLHPDLRGCGGLSWEWWRHWLVGEAGEMAAVYVGAGASWLLTLSGWQEDMLDQLCG